MKHAPSIAIVHDRLNVRGGGEKFLEQLAELYPQAPIYSLLYEPSLFYGSSIAKHRIHTSFINHLPLANKKHRFYIPLMPLAIERFDLSNYDIILSSSAAFAHGVRTNPGQLHISYIHSPMRYAWHQYRQHMAMFGLAGLPIGLFLAALRRWDRAAAQRPNILIANSNWTATCIREAFHRESRVIYEPVNVKKFHPAARRGDYYLTVSRLVPYKRVDVIVEAFSILGYPLMVIGDGPELVKIKRKAASNVRFLMEQTNDHVAEIASAAKAFVFAAEEDFGIAAVEAQAAGCPVIAYGRGGLRETVIQGKTGIFFNEQNTDSLEAAVRSFENGEYQFDENEICANARRFSAENFRKTFSAFVSERWQEFSSRI
jgi:glycosyltransferase involved in cell wall biosynthesis